MLRREIHRHTGLCGPVIERTPHLFPLRRIRAGAGFEYGWIDLIVDAADEKRAPTNIEIVLLHHRLDVVKRQTCPRRGHIEEEFNRISHAFI